jgi:hypothetical protein
VRKSPQAAGPQERKRSAEGRDNRCAKVFLPRLRTFFASTQNCVACKLDSAAASPLVLPRYMKTPTMPEAKRLTRRWRGLVLGLVLIGGGACLFSAGRTSHIAPASVVGAAVLTNPAIPTASGIHAPAIAATRAAVVSDQHVATVTIAEPIRAVVSNAMGFHCTPTCRPGKRFSFNSTSTIGLS